MSLNSVLHSKTKNVYVNNGVADENRKVLANNLSEMLADSYLLYLKTQGVHWNVSGPLFYSVHKLTEEQYEDLAQAIDEIAERIRSIGGIAPSSFGEYSELSKIKEMSEPLNAREMLKQLMEDNEYCSRNLRKAVSEAEKVNDVKTADMLTSRIGQHEENAWMLRAIIS